MGLAACENTNLQLVVTTYEDGSDAAPGDGVCERNVGAGDCSLPRRDRRGERQPDPDPADRAAPGRQAFQLVAGVAPDDTNAFGDLDIDPASGAMIITGRDLSPIFQSQVIGGGIDGILDVHGGEVAVDQLDLGPSVDVGVRVHTGATRHRRPFDHPRQP